ncbi:MAG: CYTH domain-containing protein [Ginsengibacter sp.]
MGIEIERKFLVKAEEWISTDKPAPSLLRQGYICTDPSRSIRVRYSQDNSFITIKGAKTGISRNEFEYPIPDSDAINLLDQFCTSELEKKRYIIIYKNKKWEVDVFLKENEGLIIAEIELQNPEEEFELPIWIGKEVTHEERYYNANLVQKPFRKW